MRKGGGQDGFMCREGVSGQRGQRGGKTNRRAEKISEVGCGVECWVVHFHVGGGCDASVDPLSTCPSTRRAAPATTGWRLGFVFLSLAGLLVTCATAWTKA